MNENCKICGFKTREIRQKKFGITYYVCDQCEFISKDNNARISPKEELVIYSRHNNTIEDPRYVAYFVQFIEAAVMPYCKSGKKGLDFGSGSSPVLAMILEKNYDFKMDIYDLFYAPEKIYENQKYDLVTSTEVVEHLPDPLTYFRQFKELLNDGGLLSIMTIFHPKDDAAFLNWHYMRDMSHISFYTPKTMAVIAEIIGLKIVYCNGQRFTSFKI